MSERRFLLLDLYHCFVNHPELVLNLLQHPTNHYLSVFHTSLYLLFPDVVLVFFVNQLANLRLESEKLHCLLLQNRD